MHDESFGATFDVVEIPEELKAEAKVLRGKLIEEVAAYDENLLEKYMEDEDSITEDEACCASCCRNGYVYHSNGLWFFI